MATRLTEDILERRFPQFMAVYLGASWGIIQFFAFLEERFLLSPHWTDLVMLTALLLLPSAGLFIYFHGRKGADLGAVVFGTGRLAEMRGDRRAAIAAYERERELSPTDATIAAQIGRVHRQVAHLERALETWAPADEDFRWARRARERLAELRG